MPCRNSRDLVIEIVGRALRCDVAASDNLFDIGATSLSVALISTELERALALDVPIRALYEHATIRELVEWIDGRQAACTQQG